VSADHQTDALLRAGVERENIHIDTASGAKSFGPMLDLVLQLLREGATLKVTRLDRLSRSVLHLVTLGANLREHGIGLHPVRPSVCLPRIGMSATVSAGWCDGRPGWT
jgi:DNA invertase Pin-like site-specific DNA recombinase